MRRTRLLPAAAAALVLLGGCVRSQNVPADRPAGPVTFNLTAMEYSFRPAGIQAEPGQKVTINIRNVGEELHNFTAESLNEDRDIPPGETITIEFTASTKETHNRFYCKYHRDQDMGGNLNIPSIDTPGGGGPPGGRPEGPP
ncbi:MAG: cupredoxin domain-containing protein [Actinomycetota bacterium]